MPPPGTSVKSRKPKTALQIAKATGAKVKETVRPIGRPRGRGFSKERILAIATKMFAERGYAALSIRDIAAASRINIPSIYHFFGGKENLYDSCCKKAFTAIAARLHASLLAADAPQARIRSFTVCLSGILLENKDFRRLLLQEIILRDESRHHDDLTMHSFVKEFAMLVKEVAALEGKQRATEHAFSIYALTFGLILLRRTSEVAGVDQASMDPVRLAERVLGIVLPHQNWKA